MRLPYAVLATGFCTLALAVALAGSAAAVSGPFAVTQAQAVTLTPPQLVRAQASATKGRLSADGAMLTFGRKASIVVTTGPENDMLSFRIQGIRNPTLAVPTGSELTVLFVNTDDDMYHDLRFGVQRKHYASDMKDYDRSSVGTPPLLHETNERLHAERLVVKAPAGPGEYVYVCTVTGHARGGMVGFIVVR